MSLKARLQRIEQQVQDNSAYYAEARRLPVDVEAWRVAASVYHAHQQGEPCELDPVDQYLALEQVWSAMLEGSNREAEERRHEAACRSVGLVIPVAAIWDYAGARTFLLMDLEAMEAADQQRQGLPINPDQVERATLGTIGIGGKVLCRVEDQIERSGWACQKRLDTIEAEYVEWQRSGEELEAWHTARCLGQGFARCRVVDLLAFDRLVQWQSLDGQT